MFADVGLYRVQTPKGSGAGDCLEHACVVGGKCSRGSRQQASSGAEGGQAPCGESDLVLPAGRGVVAVVGRRERGARSCSSQVHSDSSFPMASASAFLIPLGYLYIHHQAYVHISLLRRTRGVFPRVPSTHEIATVFYIGEGSSSAAGGGGGVYLESYTRGAIPNEEEEDSNSINLKR